MMQKIYNMDMGKSHNRFVRGFKVNEKGVITESWTFQKNGNGGLINDESAAKPYIGRSIKDFPEAYRVQPQR